MGPWGSLVILPALGEEPPAGSFTSCNPPEKPVTPVQIRAAPLSPFLRKKAALPVKKGFKKALDPDSNPGGPAKRRHLRFLPLLSSFK